jgi:Cytochrome c554 and c-prime
VLLVDNGGFFPEDDLHEDVAWFLMDAMKLLGTDAVGIGDRDLRFGYARLKDRADHDKLTLVSANLLLKSTKAPAFEASTIKKVGTVNVGVFGLISDKADLGPARDSLTTTDPAVTAQKAVADLRKRGATVVVLLSQLGKVETEDLVTAVDGIDVAIVGRNVPLVQKGRQIKSTMLVYGGEQGQYMGRTVVTLDAKKNATALESEMFILGPEVGEKKEVAAVVQGFEDKFNEKLRVAEKEQAAKNATTTAQNEPDHYVGDEVCARCHKDEADQWKTTAHSHAWQTLVDKKKDAMPDCIPCHVLGYNKAGGFVSASATPKMSNVQCESCHGMGTGHEAFPAKAAKITDQTCVTCHTVSNSPTFDFATYSPHIMHKFAGKMPPLPPKPAGSMGGK